MKRMAPFFIGLTFIVVIVGTATFLMMQRLDSSEVNANPIDSTVDKNETISLYNNSLIRVKNTALTFRIARFVNSPCPPGTKCIWSGQKVDLEILKNGEPIEENGYIFTFSIESSNYENFANVKVGTIFDECITNNDKTSCATTVQSRFSSPSDCENAIGVLNVSECKEIVNAK